MKVSIGNEWVEVEEGGSAKTVAQKLHLTAPGEAIAVDINGSVVDLHHPLKEGDLIKFLSFSEPAGKAIFWHTSAHVLAQAILRLWPQAKPTTGPSIESGFYYDFADLNISEEDFEKIEKEVREILKEGYKIKRHQFKNKEEAVARFKSNRYKVELIEGFEEDPITAYEQGEFFDLCRGPHLDNVGKIKAFKVLKTSGAYWKGDPTREMITRIYGIAYPDPKLLKEYLLFLEEVKKRDHRVIGAKLDLFSIQEEAPGMPFIHPKGMIIWNNLLAFLRNLLLKANYVEIKTPLLLAQELWERSGHWLHYREQMYSFEVEDRKFAIKPMNCPGCMLYYKSRSHSYRSLPLRVAEIGNVYRHELSGALSGLFRVRGFHQDDAHIFVKPSDIKLEILDIFGIVEKIYSTFGLVYRLELSTRPKKSIGGDEEWEVATNGLREALEEWGEAFRINEGDGAFYGPKIDIHVQDCLGRSWQCGTIQLDMALPEKFELEYKDKDGILKRPILLHRAIFGSIERFFGILIEHYAGKFPLWLSPLPIRIIPISDRHHEYAHQLKRQIEEAGLISDIDMTHESISKKIRNAQLLQINYMLTVGDKEMENKTVSLRTRENIVHGEISPQLFLEDLKEEIEKKSLLSPYTEVS